MTVEHSREDSLHHIADDAQCCICGEVLKPYLFPIIYYTANLYICRKCGVQNKNGLIADLIELAATEEIRSIDFRARLKRYFVRT